MAAGGDERGGSILSGGARLERALLALRERGVIPRGGEWLHLAPGNAGSRGNSP